jgi:hypothetical protein
MPSPVTEYLLHVAVSNMKKAMAKWEMMNLKAFGRKLSYNRGTMPEFTRRDGRKA